MSDHPLSLLLRQVRQLAGAEAEQTDRQLLQRFATAQDEDAFAVLVRRHGAMVFGVCRRLLPGSHDAEDAFQATFVLLAQKASGGHWHESAAGWLHEAAQRVALHARRLAALRQSKHREAAVRRAEADSSTEANAFSGLWLEEELRRLPEKHRIPVVLCHLEGHSHEEAARLLGWPVGTVKGRIARAIEQLRRHLARQGEPCSVGALALAKPLLVSPETLARATVNIAVLVSRGAPVAETASASVTALLSAVWPGLFTGKVKVALVLLLGVLAAGAAVGARRPAPAAPTAIARAAPPTDRRPLSVLEVKGMVRLPHRTSVTGLSYSPDGKTLATGNADSDLFLWDVASGKELWRATNVEAQSVAFSPDGRTLAAGGWKGVMHLLDTKGSKLRELGASKDIYALAFSPDGKILAEGGRNGGVHLWNAVSGKPVRFLKGEGRVQSVAFSPDGKLLAYATTDDRMYVFDWDSGEEVPRFQSKERQGGHVAFSPDGRILATSGSEKGNDCIDFRETATGRLIRRLRLPSDRIHALAFSPDGRAVAVGSSQPTVKVWGLATGQLLGTFEGHSEQVYSVRFSPDGTTLAAASADKTAIIWDVARRMKKEKASPALDKEALDRLWTDLASEEVASAYRAMWTLRAVPEQAPPFLSERLLAATAFDERRVGKLIGELDSDRGVTRQGAETELAKMGWVVEPALRRSLKGSTSAEVRRRLTRLLRGVEAAGTDPKWLQASRAIAVLEWVGSPAAVRILTTHADGAPEARLTREAFGALRRLVKRPAGTGAK